MHIHVYIYTQILKLPELLIQPITCHILSDYDLDNHTFSAEV